MPLSEIRLTGLPSGWGWRICSLRLQVVDWGCDRLARDYKTKNEKRKGWVGIFFYSFSRKHFSAVFQGFFSAVFFLKRRDINYQHRVGGGLYCLASSSCISNCGKISKGRNSLFHTPENTYQAKLL